jgi:hypothetical protein
LRQQLRTSLAEGHGVTLVHVLRKHGGSKVGEPNELFELKKNSIPSSPFLIGEILPKSKIKNLKMK